MSSERSVKSLVKKELIKMQMPRFAQHDILLDTLRRPYATTEFIKFIVLQ